MIRAYIATGYRNRAAYDAARCMLAARGVSITYDWTTAEPPPTHQRADRDAFLRWSAKREHEGVLLADLVLVLLPGGLGTHAELGLALGAYKAVVIYTPRPGLLVEDNGDPRCIFYSEADEVVHSWDELGRWLDGYLDEAILHLPIRTASPEVAVEDETTQATDGAAFPSPPPSFNRAASSDPSNGGATS